MMMTDASDWLFSWAFVHLCISYLATKWESSCLSVVARLRAKMRFSKIILRTLLWQRIPRSRFASLDLYSNWEMQRDRKPDLWVPAWFSSFVWQGGRVPGQAFHATSPRFGRKSNGSTAPNTREHEVSRERIFHTIRFAICIASKTNTFLCDGEFWTALQN